MVEVPIENKQPVWCGVPEAMTSNPSFQLYHLCQSKLQYLECNHSQ